MIEMNYGQNERGLQKKVNHMGFMKKRRNIQRGEMRLPSKSNRMRDNVTQKTILR